MALTSGVGCVPISHLVNIGPSYEFQIYVVFMQWPLLMLTWME